MRRYAFPTIVLIIAFGLALFGFKGSGGSFKATLAPTSASEPEGSCPYLSYNNHKSFDIFSECPASSPKFCDSPEPTRTVLASSESCEDKAQIPVKFAVLGEDTGQLPPCECQHCHEAGKCVCAIERCGCNHCAAVRDASLSSTGEVHSHVHSDEGPDEEPYVPANGICPSCGMPWNEKSECEMCHTSRDQFYKQAYKMIQKYDLPASVYIFKEVTGPYETAITEGVKSIASLGSPVYKVKWEDGIFAVYLNNPRETPPSKLRTAVGVRTNLTEDEVPKLPDGFSFKAYDAVKAIGIEAKGEYGSPQVEAFWYPLFDYLEANGYEIAGPSIENFLDNPSVTPAEKLRTRLLIPIKAKDESSREGEEQNYPN